MSAVVTYATPAGGRLSLCDHHAPARPSRYCQVDHGAHTGDCEACEGTLAAAEALPDGAVSASTLRALARGEGYAAEEDEVRAAWERALEHGYDVDDGIPLADIVEAIRDAEARS